ncbi:MAG: GNAT family N-acetyltransferase [Pseudomonadota bacterium]
MSIEVLMAAPEDLARFERIAPDVFDNPVEPDLLMSFLRAPHQHLAVACARDLLVGMASGVMYHHPDKPRELFLNEVGVSATWQRQGIARRLLRTLLDAGRAQGAQVAWVLTEADNLPACALYEALDGQREGNDLVMFTFDLHVQPRARLA